MNKPLEHRLIDSYGREISYLRISLTDRCNMRCVYCMSEEMQFLPKAEVLSFEEIVELSKAFIELGIRKIRLTGGEPLIRKNSGELIRKIGDINGLKELTLTTNGIKLKDNMDSLLAAGIKRINVSLDSLCPETFAAMGRTNTLGLVLEGLNIAKQKGLKIRLNVVVLPNVNQDQIITLLDYAVAKGFDIVFIEEMPLGATQNSKNREAQIFSEQVLNLVKQSYVLSGKGEVEQVSQLNSTYLSGPARYQTVEGTQTQVGFISPHTHNFCESCNRIRITAEGKLLWCLGQENAIDLRAILRSDNYQRSELKKRVVGSLHHKPKSHDFKPKEVSLQRFMSMTGG